MTTKMVDVVLVILVDMLKSSVISNIYMIIMHLSYMQLISVRKQLRQINVKITHHNNGFVDETVTVKTTLW